MESAIRVENLSKSYRFDEMDRKRSRTLGETIMEAVAAPWRRVSRARGNGTAGPVRARPADTFWALKDVSFEVQPGEVVAVIGPNGAGKSTLFKILSRVTRPTHGLVEVRGRLGSLLEVGTGFHPELSGRENVFLEGAILGMPHGEVERKFDEIVGFAEIDHFIDMPVKRYSSGMLLRLAFSVAAYLEPDILLLDEVMAVGDAAFQEKCRDRILGLTRQGITTMIITHSPGEVEEIAQRCIYIRSGKLLFDGDVYEGMHLYALHTHQYSAEDNPMNDRGGEALPADGSQQGKAAEKWRPSFPPPTSAPPITASRTGVGTDNGQSGGEAADALLAVEATNAAGESQLMKGDDLHVILRYRAAPSPPPLHWEITLWTEAGVKLATADTRLSDQAEFPTGEECTITCSFPAPPLPAGKYVIRAVMYRHEMPVAAWGVGDDPRLCGFEVGSGGDKVEGWWSSQWAPQYGLLRLPCHWSPSELSVEPPPSEPQGESAPEEPAAEAVHHATGAASLAIRAEQPVYINLNLGVPPVQPAPFANYQTQPAEEPAPSEATGEEMAGPPWEEAAASESPAEDADNVFQIPDTMPGYHPGPFSRDIRRELLAKEPGAVIGFLDYAVRVANGHEFYTQYKDIFFHRIYHFETSRPAPVVIDGGSNIGMSIVYYKHIYPRANVTAFECEPQLFRLLQENVRRNGLADVTLIHAALGGRPGTVTLSPPAGAAGTADQGTVVQVRPLSEFLRDPVDFLKLKIGGAELDVLQELETSGKLDLVRELVLEYHGYPNQEQQLGPMLDLLARQKFRYLLHDFDPQTNLTTKPPFHLGPDTRVYCLVYAKRM